MEFDREECILFGKNNLQESDRTCILLFSYQDFADINIHQICNILMESRKFSVRYLARIMAGNANASMGRLLTFIGDELNLAISQINEVSPKVIKRALGMLILNQERSGKYFLTRASTSKGLSIPMFTYSRIWWWWHQRHAKLDLHLIRYIGTNLYHLIMSM